MSIEGRRRTAWIVALLFAMTLSVWLMEEPDSGVAGDEDELRGSRIFPGEPRHLRLQTAGIACHYSRGETWRGGCGKEEFALNAETVAQIAMAARMRAEQEFSVSGETLGDFGLDAPAMVFQAETKAGPVSLRFGALAPDGLSRYAWWNERKLAITVPDFHYRNLRALPGVCADLGAKAACR